MAVSSFGCLRSLIQDLVKRYVLLLQHLFENRFDSVLNHQKLWIPLFKRRFKVCYLFKVTLEIVTVFIVSA